MLISSAAYPCPSGISAFYSFLPRAFFAARGQHSPIRILRNPQQPGSRRLDITNPLKTFRSLPQASRGARRMSLTVNEKITPSLCGFPPPVGKRRKEFTFSVENPVGKPQRQGALPLFAGRVVNLRKI